MKVKLVWFPAIPIYVRMRKRGKEGPLNFVLLYVNSLCNLGFSKNDEIAMYADDLVLYKSITSEEDWTDLQNDNHIQSNNLD